MRNEQFKTLISLLESDPKMLHDLLINGGGNAEVEAILSDVDRQFVAGTPIAARLRNALFHDELEDAARRDAVAACVDSCEASGNGNPYELSGCDVTCGGVTGSLGTINGFAAEQSQCECTKAETCGLTCSSGSTCGPGSCDYTCSVTMAEYVASQVARASAVVALQCDENYTCSCTTYTCDGPTCGGSTCTATCTGDSCGNTCGDSCGWTTNLTLRSRMNLPRGSQRTLWR